MPVILVVDDEPDARELARIALSSRGFFVLTAPDGRTALTYIRSVVIDLLFVDIVLPGGMNGLQLARLAQAIHPGLKLLCTTGFGIPEAWPRAPALPILEKPYHPSQLVAEIERAVTW